MGGRINVYSVELVKESAKVYGDIESTVRSPEDAYRIIESVLNLSSKTNEHFVLMCLNVKNRVMGVHTLHVGNLNSSIVDTRTIFQAALLNNAASIMVFHNHPSGDPSPSYEDIEVTKKIKEAGKLLQIQLLDHIVVGEDRYISLAELGNV